MTRTILSIALLGILCSASGCGDQWLAETLAGLAAAHDPVVEVLGGDNDRFFYLEPLT